MPVLPQKSVHSQEASGRSMLMLMSNSANPMDDSGDLRKHSDDLQDEACAHPAAARQI